MERTREMTESQGAQGPERQDGATTGRSQGNLGVALFGLATLPIAGLLLFSLMLAFGLPRPFIANVAWAIATAVVCLIPMMTDQARAPEQRHILLSLLGAAWLIYFSLPIFTQYLPAGGYTGGIGMSVNNVLPPDLARGQAVVLVALIALLGGYWLPIGRIAASAFPRPRYEWSLQATLAAALILMTLGWVIYTGSFFGVIPRSAGSGLLGTFAQMQFFGIGLLTLAVFRYRSALAVTVLGIAVPLTMGFNFFTGSKGRFFMPLTVIAFTYVTVNRRLKLRWVAMGVLAMSLLYPASQFYREVVMAGLTRNAADVIRNPIETLKSVSSYASSFEPSEYLLAGLRMTSARVSAVGGPAVIVRETPRRVPFQNGRTIAFIPLSYVPRILWPGKPILDIGQWVTDNYAGGPGIRSSTGPTWVGDLYYNWGMPSVIIGMIILGAYFRLLHETLFRSNGTIPLQWTAVIMTLTVPMTINGPLLAPINVLPFYGGLILVTHLVIRLLSGGSVVDSRATAARPLPRLSR